MVYDYEFKINNTKHKIIGFINNNVSVYLNSWLFFKMHNNNTEWSSYLLFQYIGYKQTGFWWCYVDMYNIVYSHFFQSKKSICTVMAGVDNKTLEWQLDLGRLFR